MTLPGALLRSLAGVVGEQLVLTGDATAGFAVDWTGRFRGRTPATVRPKNTAEVAAVLALCTDAGLPVVPQGGNTGLVGGGVPLHGEVVLSLTRLNQLGPVDREASQVTAGAGVTLAVITAARLRLVPRLRDTVTALAGVGGLDELHALARRAVREVPGLVSAEFFTRTGLDILVAHAGLAPPLAGSAEAYLLLEAAGAVADGRHEDAVFRFVASLGGSISAEHGIGALKAPWLPLARTDAERALFARIRSALDPAGTLNPNVLPR